ncbi:hypothetical protein SMITH_452 [Smithella sp. ME-1]|uniref:Alginate export domain-containing protein n=1 Tax=hydrocarbon metagenome TaxID=938273 RepID=A0A0W8FM17_9ZZZZ|nr:hypothetical protein SMITH_452 [Smithella sp. ME-1]
MKKETPLRLVYATFFLFTALLLLPVITVAKEIPPAKNAGEQMEKVDPGDTDGTDITGPSDENQTRFQKIKNYFEADLRILTYGIVQEPAKTSQNPNNDFLQYPQYVAVAEVRPDFRFDSKFLELAIKPRAKFDFKSWQEGIREYETEWNDDWYVNEWLIRFKILDRVFASYGRENLQWGPSFLFSPSNPFFYDNGRSNPFMEVPGMDFGRVVFIPHRLWTISLMVNIDEGRNIIIGPDPFEKIYAVKIDYTGRENYASLIVSQKDHRKTLGFFGGWTVSDALLLYAEGSMQRGSDALYPQKDESPLGVSMSKIHQGDMDVKPIILVGGSYTLEESGTFSLEYVYNMPGYNGEDTDTYFTLRRDAATAFEAGGSSGILGQAVLSQTANPGLRFLRRNYMMLQYNQTNIRNKLDVTFRWTQNIDDGSAQFLGLMSYSLGDHWELFSSGIVNAGPGDTEYGSTLSYQLMFGVKFAL